MRYQPEARYVCMYVCMYVCICVCVCMYVCVYICTYVCNVCIATSGVASTCDEAGFCDVLGERPAPICEAKSFQRTPKPDPKKPQTLNPKPRASARDSTVERVWYSLTSPFSQLCTTCVPSMSVVPQQVVASSAHDRQTIMIDVRHGPCLATGYCV